MYTQSILWVLWYRLHVLLNVPWKPFFSSHFLSSVVTLCKDSLARESEVSLGGCKRWERWHCDLGPAVSNNATKVWFQPNLLNMENRETGKELQDCQIKEKGSLWCKILAHLQVLEKAEQRKKKGEKLPPNIDFWKQALGSNLGQRFKSVLYLNQLT